MKMGTEVGKFCAWIALLTRAEMTLKAQDPGTNILKCQRQLAATRQKTTDNDPPGSPLPCRE